MKTRIITGVIAAVLFLSVLVQPYTWILAIVIAALCSVASYELLGATKFCPSKLVQIISMIYAAIVPFWYYFYDLTENIYIPLLITMGYIITIGLVQIFQFDVQPITSSIFAVTMTIWSSIALSSIFYIRSFQFHGLFFTILMLLTCWMSDTGAYFVGVLFGSHKLCPEISPKKTIEGFIGGIVTALVVCFLITFFYNKSWNSTAIVIQILPVLIIVFAGSCLSVVGDLTASLLKRLCDIKDYGNLFPGHGGVMDRFDSLLFTAPLYLVCLIAFKYEFLHSTIELLVF